MKRIILLTIALLGGVAWAQQPEQKVSATATESSENMIYVVVEQDPEFPGGMDALYQWIGSNYKWPEEASSCDAYGKIFVTFIIEKDGSVSNARLLRDIGCGHGDAVLEMMQRMPKWKPGKQNGKKVRVQYNLPIVINVQ